MSDTFPDKSGISVSLISSEAMVMRLELRQGGEDKTIYRAIDNESTCITALN